LRSCARDRARNGAKSVALLCARPREKRSETRCALVRETARETEGGGGTQPSLLRSRSSAVLARYEQPTAPLHERAQPRKARMRLDLRRLSISGGRRSDLLASWSLAAAAALGQMSRDPAAATRAPRGEVGARTPGRARARRSWRLRPPTGQAWRGATPKATSASSLRGRLCQLTNASARCCGYCPGSPSSAKSKSHLPPLYAYRKVVSMTCR